MPAARLSLHGFIGQFIACLRELCAELRELRVLRGDGGEPLYTASRAGDLSERGEGWVRRWGGLMGAGEGIGGNLGAGDGHGEYVGVSR